MAVTVRLIGGARKALSSDTMELDCDEATVGSILDLLASRTSGELGASNVLVAVNGADSSAVGGRGAVVRAGDDVAVIPVVHGGAAMGGRAKEGAGAPARTGAAQAVPLVRESTAAAQAGGRRRAGRIEAYVVRCRGAGGAGGGKLLDQLRAEFPLVALQAVAGRFVLSESHLRRVIAVSVSAERRRTMVAKRLETDMLARLAGTAQISAAIGTAGMGSAGSGPYVIIALAAPAGRLAPLRSRLGPLSAPAPASAALPASRARFLARHFGISARHRAAVLSQGRADPLEELLVERAASIVAA